MKLLQLGHNKNILKIVLLSGSKCFVVLDGYYIKNMCIIQGTYPGVIYIKNKRENADALTFPTTIFEYRIPSLSKRIRTINVNIDYSHPNTKCV